VWAILARPANRIVLTARLRKVASARGAVPVLSWERSAWLTATDPDTAALLCVGAGGSLLTRTTHLVGSVTGTVYVRARSVFAVEAVPPPLQADLRRTDEPIGRLLRRHRIETFREILSLQVPDSGYPIEPSRRYLVYIAGVPALVEETFAPSASGPAPEPPVHPSPGAGPPPGSAQPVTGPRYATTAARDGSGT
jgi:chorismate-pyruvate lyase